MEKKSNQYIIVLVLITIFNIAVLYLRNALVGTSTYNFLLWNLFLAIVPLVIVLLYNRLFASGKLWITLLAGFAWLLFYPNAPYMVSDLIHVDATDNIVLYDTLIIFSFAMLALFYGFYSLKLMHIIFTKWMTVHKANMLAALCVIVASFGIYLGRILRLNSWDIFHHPVQVFHTIIDHLFPVNENPTTYAIIFIFSAVQFILLIMMKDMESIEGANFINSKNALTKK